MSGSELEPPMMREKGKDHECNAISPYADAKNVSVAKKKCK